MSERTVLVVDDEPGHRLMVKAVLEHRGWSVAEAPDGESALAMLGSLQPDVVLVDMRMPGMNGLAVLDEIKLSRPQMPVVLLTAYGSVGSAVDAMKKGAFDYLTKPADNDELEAVLEKAWRHARLVGENENLKRILKRGPRGPELIGQSPGMLQVKDFIDQVGPSEATVLILGESGTGKELVAERLHAASQRREGPLVKVNCAALPGELLESELFGYVKGAFTGAVRDKPGRFQLARGGTLFLDEVGELPMALQAKLLRALQERTVEPLGGVKPVETDVRILAATNRDLTAEVAEGRFREDLFYRLNVLEVDIPPLRDRVEDIPLLATFLLTKLGEKNRKQIRSVSGEYMTALMRYGWPGNVRELENVLERGLILTRSDTLTPDLLPPQIAQALQEAPRGGAPRTGQPAAAGLALGQPAGTAGAGDAIESAAGTAVGTAAGSAATSRTLDDAERDALVRALEVHAGHRERTAEALGISRRTLQYKLKKYGLTRRG